jgi:ACS family tartrate transporter-like MFS transporter
MATIAADHPDAPYRAASRRIVPFLFVLYILAHIDRGNLAYAKSQIETAFGFDKAVYPLGVGMFYLGYALLEVPSNVLMTRVGPRRWIARILATWGAICMGMAFIKGAQSFYACRFLLGLAEAGFMPGAMLYLTYWFPSRLRARAGALFLTSIPVAIVISGPLSGVCLRLDGLLGYAGWQWLFLVEGLPSVIAAFVVLRLLPDGPADARWLNADHRTRIEADLAVERARHPDTGHSPWRLLAQPRLWLLIVPYFLLITGFYGLINWLPALFKELPFSKGETNDIVIGTFAALPYVVAGIAMVVVARSSDRRGERRWHAAVSGMVSMLGLVYAASYPKDQVAMAGGMTLACCGMFAALGPFWSLVIERLGERDKTIGIACVNALGCLGGFFGPKLIDGDEPGPGLAALAISFALFALWILALRPPRGAAQAAPRPATGMTLQGA